MKKKTLFTYVIGITCVTILLFVAITRFPNQNNPLISQGASGALIDGDAVANETSAENRQCSAQPLDVLTYQVTADIEVSQTETAVYTSHLQFELEMYEQAGEPFTAGFVHNIHINEGFGDLETQAVYFTTQYEQAKQFTRFTELDLLGLPANNPLQFISQVLKNLSIAPDQHALLFTYDPWQKQYIYRSHGHFVERLEMNAQVTRPDAGNAWIATMGDDCFPETIFAKESHSVTGEMQYQYVLSLKRTPSIDGKKKNLSLPIHSLSNAQHPWKAKALSQAELNPTINNTQQMWESVHGFKTNQRVGELIQAARHMIEELPAEKLADVLLDETFSDSSKRDLIFGLGISDHPLSESYLMDTMKALPQSLSSQSDLQKVRIMVAMAGNGHASEAGFQFLLDLSRSNNGPAENTTNISGANNTSLSNTSPSSLAGNNQQQKANTNVAANALINLGTMAAKLEQKGQLKPVLRDALVGSISQSLDSFNRSSSAIYAIGNAKLEGFNEALQTKLHSAQTRERYAAGTVLAQQPEMYNALLSHLRTEPSDLVATAIINGIEKNKLSSEQLARLNDISLSATDERRTIIDRLLQNES